MDTVVVGMVGRVLVEVEFDIHSVGREEVVARRDVMGI